MVPVYFQTSRWLRAYLEKPAYADGYKPIAAQKHADSLLGKLTVPEPAAAPIKKLGVASAPFLNFDYIPVKWRDNANLLQLPCGFPGQNGREAGSNNGKADYATWRNAFHQLFTQDGDFHRANNHPLFAIIDTDSAHHLSAPLVERAVRFADPGRVAGAPTRTMIVINFDAHTDFGGTASPVPTINCQSWGRFVANTVPGIHNHPLSDVYVRFGLQKSRDAEPTWEAGEWHEADANYVTKPIDYQTTGDVLTAQLDVICTAVTATTGAQNVDAYVSVDRDVLELSYTNYFDGPFPPEPGIAGVKKCLTYLASKNVRIIGFDITGLPTFPGGVRPGRPGPTFTTDDAMNLAEKQIVALWTTVSEI
jgi:hypothetical protein